MRLLSAGIVVFAGITGGVCRMFRCLFMYCLFYLFIYIYIYR
nr:MAG TPA: hypothetical protein [Caudoviricetes sp.]